MTPGLIVMSAQPLSRCLLVFVVTASVATGADAPRSGTDLIAAWDALRSRIATARVERSLDISYAVGGQPPALDRVETTVSTWSRAGRAADFSMTQGKTRERTVSLENPRYTAELVPAKSAGQWLLRSSGEAVVQPDLCHPSVLPWTDCLRHVPIPDWLSRPTVQLTRTEPRPDRVTRMYFENRTNGSPKDSFDSLIAAHFDVSDDPDRRLVGAEYTTRGRTSTAVWRIVLEYKPVRPGEIPILEKWTSETIQVTPATTRGIRTQARFEIEYNPKMDPTEFYLSHYGLPEPPGISPPSRPTPTYVWLLLAAGGLGVVAFGCRWLLKRGAKVIPPATPPVG